MKLLGRSYLALLDENRALHKENERLRAGACRFNCRTARTMFCEGYDAALEGCKLDEALQAYEQWKQENK